MKETIFNNIISNIEGLQNDDSTETIEKFKKLKERVIWLQEKGIEHPDIMHVYNNLTLIDFALWQIEGLTDELDSMSKGIEDLQNGINNGGYFCIKELIYA